MCEFNPVWSEKDQAGPCWGGCCEVRLGSQSMALGSAGPWAGRGQAGTELETNTAPAELRQWLRLQGWAEMQPRVLGLWVVVPRGAGQGCAGHPGPWENKQPRAESRTAVHCWGALQWGSSPSSRRFGGGSQLCQPSAEPLVCQVLQNQCWKSTRSSSATVGNCFSLTQSLTSACQMELLSKLTF